LRCKLYKRIGVAFERKEFLRYFSRVRKQLKKKIHFKVYRETSGGGGAAAANDDDDDDDDDDENASSASRRRLKAGC